MTTTKKQSVNVSSARSFVGRHLNVTLADGVLVNVKLLRIEERKRLVFADPLAGR